MVGLRKRKQIVYARSKLGSVNLTEIRRVVEVLRARVEHKKIAKPDLAAMHGHSIRNRAEILVSTMCGCFACLKTFPSVSIGEWWDLYGTGSSGAEVPSPELGVTAVCPYCGLDAVLGDKCGRELTSEFLAQMQHMWFDEPETIRLKSSTE